MRCLCSVFDVKKQGKPIWEVRMRNWKLREGENLLSGSLEGISQFVERAVTRPRRPRESRVRDSASETREIRDLGLSKMLSEPPPLTKLSSLRSLSNNTNRHLGEGKEARGIEYNICSSTVFVFMVV
ncbi:hypothetical protein GQ457_16G015620 [Hibiscus cannabinus]